MQSRKNLMRAHDAEEVMSRHSWKARAAQPKIKYFTQVKPRPPTFVAFLGGKTKLAETDLRFLTRSLKEDVDIGGIHVRIMQRSVQRNTGSGGSSNAASQATYGGGRKVERIISDKRTLNVETPTV